MLHLCVFFFQAEDGIRDLVRSRGLGDVYKRQALVVRGSEAHALRLAGLQVANVDLRPPAGAVPKLSLIHI